MRILIDVGTMLRAPGLLADSSRVRDRASGEHDGTLAPCPNKPNCVSSTATDRRHAIAPLTFTGAPDAALRTLQDVVLGLARTRVITRETDYLYVECTNPLLGFVDRRGCPRPPGEAPPRPLGLAARYSDLGVNRARSRQSVPPSRHSTPRARQPQALGDESHTPSTISP